MINKTMVLLFLSVIVLISAMGVTFLYQKDKFPIKEVVLENKLYEQDFRQLHQVASQSINGGFFSMDINVFRKKLEALPWIESISVKKKWPESVYLNIKEKQVVAKWVKQKKEIKTINKMLVSKWDKKSLLSSEGEVFNVDLTKQQENKYRKIMSYSAVTKLSKNVLKVCQIMSHILLKAKIEIKKCYQDQRRSWYLSLNNGIELFLGRDVNTLIDISLQTESEQYLEHKILARVQTFVEAYQQVLKRHEKNIKTIDLRYTNGFAVSWKLTNNINNNKG